MKEYNTQCAGYSSPLREGRGVGELCSGARPLVASTLRRMGSGDESSEWKVRPMSKSELAMAYAPCLTPQGAVNRLIDWIRHNPELVEALDRTGYRKTQKLLTSLQVRIIFSYLGEP